MNILFITLGSLEDINDSNIYNDLLKEFRDNGHNVYVANPRERRNKQNTEIESVENITFLRIKTLNITKTNLIEKGLSTVIIEKLFFKAIKKYYSNINFQLIIYTTPPVTFANLISKLKLLFTCKTYLLLKDIFPQNAVDLNILKKNSIIYHYFRKQEIKLYNVSDFIGCMSDENKKYILRNNNINAQIEVNPNSISVKEISLIDINKTRNTFNLPLEKIICVYGGNLGKPQGIDFMMKCIKQAAVKTNFHFVIVGSGTEYNKINMLIEKYNLSNITLIEKLNKKKYNNLVASCDVGLIFLDHRFTIPNFPSRLLSYMENGLPVLSVTDSTTDLSKTITHGNFGYSMISHDETRFIYYLNKFEDNFELKKMGINSRNFFIDNFNVNNSYKIIMNHFDSDK